MTLMALVPIGGISPIIMPSIVQGTGSTAAAGGAAGSTGGSSFASVFADQLDKVSAAQNTADQLAVKATTGDLKSIQDYTIAATEAQLMTQLTVQVRNKAVEAFNEIMHMQV
jgi:flagellar hook-basal body complex protein FliE